MATSGIEVGHAFVSVSASGKGAAQQVQRDFNRTMPAVGKKAGGHLGAGIFAAASKFAAPLAALFAVGKLISFGKDSVGEAREAQKVGAVTNQIIKSTGGAAKITAKQIGTLTTAISNKTGVDDEAVQKGANLLLTFKNVRNEVGKGNQVFDRATQAAVDLSAAGFGSIEGASKMLGKALNDPVKGISALSRAGVTFTDQQKEQITTLVKSGKTLEAQKIIMKEVESQVGGVGAASATAGEKLAVTWSNFKELVGTQLLPTLDKLATWLATRVIPAMSNLATKIGPALKTLTGGIRAFVVSFKAADGDVTSTGFAGFMERLGFVASKIGPIFQKIGPALSPVFTILRNMVAQLKPLQPQFVAFAKVIGGALLTALPIVGQALAGIGKALGQGLVTILPPIIAGFTKLGSSGGFIRTQFLPALRGIFSAAQGLGAVVLPIIRQLAQEFLKRWPQIRPIVVEIFKTIGGIVVDVMSLVQSKIRVVTAVISFIWGKWGKQITAFTSGSFKMVLGVIGGVMKVIGGIIKVVTGVMTGDWKKAGEGIKTIVRGLKQVVVALFGDIWKNLKAIVKGLMKDLRDKFTSGVAAIGKAWDALKAVAKKPIRFVIETVLNNGLIAGFNKIAKAVGIPTIGNIPIPKGFSAGGYTGSGNPKDAAGLVHKKEYVFDEDAVRKAGGPSVLDQWRATIKGGGLNKPGDVGLPGYSAGGFVKALSYAKQHAGHPYVFGTIWDCSGFMSSLQSIIGGGGPRRLWSTPAFAGNPAHAHGFTRNKRSAFEIGVDPRAGKFGHTAGTLLGKNVESSGGVGVRVGGGARGANAGMFSWRGGLDAGGGLLGKLGAFVAAGFSTVMDWLKSLIKAPLAKLNQIGNSPFAQLAAASVRKLGDGMVNKAKAFDTGGYLQPGYTLAYNGTGRAERVVGPGGHGGGVTVQQYFPSSSTPQAAAAAANGRLVAALSARGF